jgi:hypothetical protein
LSFAFIPTYSFILEELCIEEENKLFLRRLELLLSKSMKKKNVSLKSVRINYRRMKLQCTVCYFMAPLGLSFQRHGGGEGREGLASPPPPSSVMLSQRCGKQTQPIGDTPLSPPPPCIPSLPVTHSTAALSHTFTYNLHLSANKEATI